MRLHPDFSDLLAELAHAGVRYALVGGYAVSFHARPRATKDLDLLVSPALDNLERLARALERFGAPANVVAAARAFGEEDVVYFGSPPVRVDLMVRADGIDTETAVGRAVVVSVDGVEVRILGRDDLLANKRASGRPRDLADVADLEATPPPRP